MGEIVETRSASKSEVEHVYLMSIALTGMVLVLSTLLSRLGLLASAASAQDSSFRLDQAVESMDRAIWLALLGLAGLLILSGVRSRNKLPLGYHRKRIFEPIAVATLLLGMLWVEPFQNLSGLWFGFGSYVTLAAIVCIPVAHLIIERASPEVIRQVSMISSIWVLFAYLPLTIQPIWGLKDPVHGRYVFNEIAGPISGNFALADTIPQYTALFGLPLTFFPHLQASTSFSLGLQISIYLSLLSALTLGALVIVGRKILPKTYIGLAPLTLIPLALVTSQTVETPSGAITTMLSAVPLRILPLMAVALVLMWNQRTRTRTTQVALGVTIGLSALNNFEFGLVCVLATFIVIAIQATSIRKVVEDLAWILTFAATPGVFYWLFLTSQGKEIQWSYLVLFSQGFWEGFGNIPMPLAGPHYFVLAIFVAGASVGSRFAMNHAKTPGVATHLQNAAIATTFFSLAGLGSFGYFVGRSVVSTQLQIFLCFCAPITLGLTVLLYSLKYSSVGPWNPMRALMLAPIALSLSATLQAPDIGYEWRRAIPTSIQALKQNPFDGDVQSVQRALKEFNVLNEKSLRAPVQPVIAVENGNFVSVVLGVRNASAIDAPIEASVLSPRIHEVFCEKLEASTSPILVKNFNNSEGDPLCEGFTIRTKLDDDFVVLDKQK